MKNLKKVLALVLVVAMMMTFAVSASAATYKDADQITDKYVEAVDVMSAVGVFEGTDGNLNPQGNLTREQAAKIISYLLLGKDAADKLSVSASNFSDVEVGRWSAGYIEFCYSKGIVSGHAGKFNPKGTLKGTEFAKMLLVALGYDASAESMIGASWEINTSNLAVEAGIDNGFALSEVITREQAIQMAFSTLKATCVKYVGGTSITIGDTVISQGATRQIVTATNGTAANDAISDAQDDGKDIIQLGEKLYKGKLVLKTDGDDATDTFGRPTRAWYYNDELVTKVATKTAAYTATAKADKKDPDTADKLTKNINAVLGLTGKKALPTYVVDSASFSVNGGADLDSTLANCDILTGDTIEVYVSTTGAITDVIITRYDLTQVTVKALTASEKNAIAKKVAAGTIEANSAEATATSWVSGTGFTKCYDTAFAGFDYKDKDFVLVAVNDNKVVASKAAELVTGEVTSIKSGKVCINGTYYTDNTGTDLAIGDKGTFALNQVGELEGVVTAETVTSDDVAYIYSIAKKTNTDAISEDGVKLDAAVSYTAYIVNADGTKASYPIATVKGTNTNAENTYIKGMANVDAYKLNTLENGVNTKELVCTYSINDKGEFECATASANTNVGTVKQTPAIDKTSYAIDNKALSNDTKFVFAKTNDTTKAMDVTVTTGYKNVKIANTTKVAVISNRAGTAVTVFVLAKDATVIESNTIAAVVLDSAVVQTVSDKVNYYTISVSINGGEPVELTSKATNPFGGLSNGDIILYTEKTDGTVTISTTVKYGDVEKFKAVTMAQPDYIVLNGSKKIDTTDVPVYTIAVDAENYNATTVTAGGEFNVADAANDIPASAVYALMSGEKVVALYIGAASNKTDATVSPTATVAKNADQTVTVTGLAKGASISATSADATKATVAVEGTNVKITGKAEGTVKVTVTVTAQDGITTKDYEIAVTVTGA